MRRLTRALLLGFVIVLGTRCAGGTPVVTLSPSPAAPPVRTPNPASTTTPPVPTATPTGKPSPTRIATLPIPTPLPMSSFPVPQPVAPISPSNADQVAQLARWSKGILSKVSYSPDGRFLAVASSVGVYLYDAETLEEVGFLETETKVERWAFSPDGTHLVTGGDGIVQLWLMPGGELWYTVEVHRRGSRMHELRDLAFSPDGEIIASIWRPNVVHLWRASDGALLNTLEVPEGGIGAMTFSPDGLLVTSGSERNLWVWSVCIPDASQSEASLPEGCLTLLHALKGETGWTPAKVFSSDGTLLVSVAGNGGVWLWRLEDGTVLHKLSGGPASIVFSPDGSTLASGHVDGPYSGILRLWRVEDGTLFDTLKGHKGRVKSVAFSADGKTLASASDNGTVQLRRVEDWSLLHVLEGYAHRSVSSVALSPDDAILAEGSAGGNIRLWQVSDGTLLHTLERHAGGVTSVAFSPDGSILASGGKANDVRLWRVSDGRLLFTLREHKSGVNSVAFSLDGTLLVSGGDRGQVLLWQADDGELLNTLEEYRDDDVRSVAISPDGMIVVAGREHGMMQLWQVESGELLNGLKMDPEVTSVAFSPDGRILAAATGDHRVWLWQIVDWTPLRFLTECTGNVQCVTFSPDGALLASGSEDGTVWLWQVSDGALLRTLKGHTGSVTSLAFASDGSFLASGSADGTVRFWGVGPSSAMPEPVLTPIPIPSPTPSPAGLSHPITSADGLPTGEIHHLWVAPDGQLWLVTETGIFVYADDEWVPIYEGMANHALGTDEAGRIWAIINYGWHIAAYVDDAWTIYGPNQGWVQGYGSQPVTDQLGRVWMTTGKDLRRFDPQTQTWTILSPTDIGFVPLEEPMDPGDSLTDVALDRAGNVWVGSCLQDGHWIGGQGVRWFDGERWSGSEDTAGQCVQDIEVDDAGRIWMGGFDGLIQYDPAAQAWSRFPLSPWDWPQLITSVTLDSVGAPWVTVTRFGPTGHWYSNAMYHLENGVWIAEYDPGHEVLIEGLAFGPDGAVWMCSGGTIYRLADEGQEEIGTPGNCEQMVVDGAGRVWIAGIVGSDPGLWVFEPEE